MKRRQFTWNTITTMLNLIIQFGLSFFLTSYLVRTVGDVAYGFFTMANTVINYALIVTNALNSMSARFIGIGIHSKNIDKACYYYSSVFFADLLFALSILVPSSMAIYHLDSLINIPIELVREVKILFFIVFLNMCCNVIFSVFGCIYTIKNRIDILSILQIVSNLIKATLLIFLYSLFKTSIVYLGIATLVATLVVAGGNIFFIKKYLPELKLSIHLAKLKQKKEIISSGIWNSFNQLSITLLNGLDLIVANLMVSAQAMGALSIANTIPGVISTCISALANLFTPKFLEYYSHGDYRKLLIEVKESIKFMTVISSMPISFLIAFGVPFFELWTPDTDIRLVYTLSVLVLLPQFSGGAINSMNYLYTIANKVKWQAIVLFGAGITNVVAVFTLLKFTDLGVYAIAGVSAILGFVRNFCFNAPYAAYCIKQPKYIFWPDMLKSCGGLIFSVCVGIGVNHIFSLDSWFKLIIVGGGCTIFTGGITSLLVLSRTQKKQICEKIKNEKLGDI